MGDKRQHAFEFPGLSYVLSKTNLMQNLHCIQIDHIKRNSFLFTNKNSSKSSMNQKKPYQRPPRGKKPRKAVVIISTILRTATAVATETIVAPIERIHMLMQCQNEMIKAGHLSTPYKGIKDCFLRTIKHEGILSLWRGYSANVISICASKAYPFVLYQIITSRSYLSQKMNESPAWRLPLTVAPAVICLYPLAYARIRLATDVKVVGGQKFSLDSSAQSLRNDFRNRQFSGVSDVLKKTLKSDRIHGLYRGLAVTLIGFVGCQQTYKWYRASSRQEQAGRNVAKKKPTLWLSALVVPIMMMNVLLEVFYPFSTVGRRMMLTSGEARKYKGAVDAYNQIVRAEGVSSLFKGVTAYVMGNLARDACTLGFVQLFIQLVM